MMQVYFISLIILFFNSAIYLSDIFPGIFSLFLPLKRNLGDSVYAMKGLFAVSMAEALLLMLFPAYPGPVVLGDLIPSVWILYSSVAVYLRFSGFRAASEERSKLIGFVSLIIALLHFILPSLVLI